MKRLLSITICIIMLACTSVYAIAATDNSIIQDTIIALEIMTGDGQGNLDLTRNATRAEFAKLLVSASSYKDTVQQGAGVSLFKDVKYTHWASNYISVVVNAGWMSGYIDGTFRPDQAITYEQAASAVIKLLGYEASDLLGAYPKAQISKFASLKLNKGISPAEGQALTRYECMYIFYNLMGATTKSGAIYGATLGYTMNKDGEIDYDALVKADIMGPFVMYDYDLSTLLPFYDSKAVIYRNDNLASSDDITKYDVVYYNETLKIVWAYSMRALGEFTSANPNAISPASVIVDGSNYALSTTIAKNKMSTTGEFEPGDKVALLLGMDGDVVDVISAGEIDDTYHTYYTKGPYVVSDRLSSVIPFETGQATVYRNNRAATPDAVVKYDVIYYNEYMKTVWAYSNRAIGILTSVAPNAVSPSTVTVAGNNYALVTTTAKDKLSVTGEFVIGDMVALLLGMDGDVVDVIPATEVDATYYGVVIKTEPTTFSVNVSASRTEFLIMVACTDGVTRQCVIPGDYYSAGSFVSISYAKGECTIMSPGSSNFSGRVNNTGTKLGDYAFADGIEIMDMSSDGDWIIISSSRLAGVELASGKIRFYLLNGNREITHLILSDVTGDMYAYGILTSVEVTETPADSGGNSSRSAVYRYMINGTQGTLSSTGKTYNVTNGPAVFYYNNGQISSMRNLTGVSINALAELSVTAGNQRYAISDGIQVYIRTGATYYLSTLSAINTDEYTLTGYYETIYPAGGNIRLIIAVRK